MRDWLLCAAGLAGLAGLACSSPAKQPPPPPGDDPATIRVDESSTIIHTGQIGVGVKEVSTYVFVDVANTSSVDRLVTLEGTLIDHHGAEVAPLPADEMRVPAGARRTFALVAAKAVPAARATFKVANAVPATYPPQVTIEQFNVRAGPIPVATAMARNTLDREVSAVVAATFYDAAGTILGRPFTVLTLRPGMSRSVRFEGPAATTDAAIFVGQVAFH